MINKLTEKIRKTHAPIVVGLDPMLNYIPKHIQEAAFKACGETLEGAAEAIWQFNKEIVDATYDLIPAVKPQIAMYEQFGIPGLMAFKRQWITARKKTWWSSETSNVVISVPHLLLTLPDISAKYRWAARNMLGLTKIL